MNTEEIHSRESEFHDEWARSTPVDQVHVRECFESPTAMENRFILEHMGSLKGKKLLDIGCGLGESSVYFALQGATVTATDISPEMVEKAIEVGKYHGVDIEGLVLLGENLVLPPDSFDFIYTANTIHHVTDRAGMFEQMRRALKPGGRFYSIDPIAYNPAIEVYRRMATEVRTVDEAPLRKSDLVLARKYFRNVDHREFWLAGLLLFGKYFFVDRVHPNSDRYWKRILTETESTLWWWRPLRSLDSVLTRIPGLKWWAWNMVMWGTK